MTRLGQGRFGQGRSAIGIRQCRAPAGSRGARSPCCCFAFAACGLVMPHLCLILCVSPPLPVRRTNSSMPELDGGMPPRHPASGAAMDSDARASAPDSMPPRGLMPPAVNMAAPRQPLQPNKRALAERDRELLSASHSAPPGALSQGQYVVDPDKPDEGWMVSFVQHRGWGLGLRSQLGTPAVTPVSMCAYSCLMLYQCQCMLRHQHRGTAVPLLGCGYGTSNARCAACPCPPQAANLCYKRFAKDGTAVSLSEPMVAELTEELRQLHAWCMTRNMARSQPRPASRAGSEALALSQGTRTCGPQPSGVDGPACSDRSHMSVDQPGPELLHVRTSTAGAGPGPGSALAQASPGRKRESTSSLLMEVVESPIKRQRPHKAISSSMAAGMPCAAPPSRFAAVGSAMAGVGMGGLLPQQQSVPASWAPHAALQQPQQRPVEAGPGPKLMPASRPALIPAAPLSPSRAGLSSAPPQAGQAWAHPHQPHQSQPLRWMPTGAPPAAGPARGQPWPAPAAAAPSHLQPAQGMPVPPSSGYPAGAWWPAGGAAGAQCRSRRSTVDSADAMDTFLSGLLDTQDDGSTLPPNSAAQPVP